MHGSLRREGKKKKKRKHHDTLIVIVENGMSSAISRIRFNGLYLWLVWYSTVLPSTSHLQRTLSFSPCRAHKYTSEHLVSLTIDLPSALPFWPSTPASSWRIVQQVDARQKDSVETAGCIRFLGLISLVPDRADQP